jgi:hypothetical protein
VVAAKTTKVVSEAFMMANVEITGDLRPERAQRANAARRPC